MSSELEPTTIGLSDSAHIKLQRLKEDGYFGDMIDAYRFAIALALSRGEIAEKGTRKTIFNVGTLDPDKSLYHAISALREDEDEPVYRTAERLAEWGVEEMYRLAEEDDLSLGDLLAETESVLEKIE